MISLKGLDPSLCSLGFWKGLEEPCSQHSSGVLAVQDPVRGFLSHKVNREQRREVSQPWSLPQTRLSASRRGGSELLSPLFIE